MTNFWDAGGAGCQAAYQPVGAASLAASYVNLVSPGTLDATVGVAPTHTPASGWGFNGTNQILFGPAYDATHTIGIRFASVANTGMLLGRREGAIDFFMQPNLQDVVVRWSTRSWLVQDYAPMFSGTLIFAGPNCYKNGVLNANLSGQVGLAPLTAMGIGGAQFISYCACTVQVYTSHTRIITAPEAAALSAAMLALPLAPASSRRLFAPLFGGSFG